MNTIRFQDQNWRLSDFYNQVAVYCPQCAKQATAIARHEQLSVRLFCTACGYNKEKSIQVYIMGTKAKAYLAAHRYFDAEIWYKASFKEELLWAYNLEHLNYLESYIGAKLREHKDRTHFTLLEKLPAFYHDAKNRKALLRLIDKLKSKI